MANPAVSWAQSVVWFGLLAAAAGCVGEQGQDRAAQATCQGGKCDIWGSDDRHERYELPQDFVNRFAPSIGAFVSRRSLGVTPAQDAVALQQPVATLEQSYGMCSDEKFATEPTFASCSGFYAGGDIFVTAGHCLKLYDQNDWTHDADRACRDIAIVFDAGYNAAPGTEGATPFGTFPAEAVYACKEVLHIEFDPDFNGYGNDIAILRLDRQVTGRAALPMRRSGTIPVGTEVYMAGYPTGLPLKISTGGHVLPSWKSGQAPELLQWWIDSGFDGEKAPDFFFDLEMLGGNSGGPIFNAETNEVEGVAAAYSAQNFRWGTDAAGRQCIRWGVCGQDGIECPINPGAFPVTAYASMIDAYVAEGTVDGGADPDSGVELDGGTP